MTHFPEKKIHLKNPARAILLGILLLNVLLFSIAAVLISLLTTRSSMHESLGFWASLYYTVTMVLDAGCIDNVIADIGHTGVILILVCIVTVVLGMITFTGAVIGYVNADGKTVIFSGDQHEFRVELTEKDKLIIFSNH